MTAKQRSSSPTEEVAAAMRRWGPSVWRLAFVRTGSREDADDVYQDVFLGMLTHRFPRESDEALKAWLLRCAINRCNDLGRASSKRAHADGDDAALDRLPSPSTDTLPESCLVAREEQRALWGAVSRLEPTFRDVVHLHYAEGLTCRQIADIVSCSVAAVHIRLHRARRHLRKALEGRSRR